LNPDFTPETEPKFAEPDPLLNPVDLTPDTPWPAPNEEAPWPTPKDEPLPLLNPVDLTPDTPWPTPTPNEEAPWPTPYEPEPEPDLTLAD
jgi:hypothetical protein